MSYQVIARKWRPQTFEEVIGQDAITQTLRNAIEFDRLHHAYLFSGARGVGKTTTARLLAKALNCQKTEAANPKPCDTDTNEACDSCKEIAESRSLDVLEFDAASHTGVDDIREIILESINVNAARDRFKVFIIDEVHMLSTSSFNALLKTLEEPPENVVFVMATTELHKVPDTILSRCQQFDFRTIPLKKILDRLKEIAGAEAINVSNDALREIARSGEGSMRDAQSNFDQVISFSGEKIETEDVIKALGIASAENLTKTIKAIADNNSTLALEVVEDLVERGQDLRNFSRDLLTFIRDLLIVKIAGGSSALLESAILDIKELKERSAPFLETDLIRFFNSIAETETKMRDANEPRYLLEIGLIKLIEMRSVSPVEELLARMAKLENALSLSDEGVNQEPDASDTYAEQEKKTLKSGNIRDEVPFPVKPAKDRDVPLATTPETHTKPQEYSSDEKKEAKLEPEKAVDLTEVDLAVPPKIKGSIKDKISIDPDSMPVKLEPISSEDLEHFEDKKLDKDFEERLLREGDDLKLLGDPRSLISALFGARSEKTPASQPESGSQTNGSGTATAPAKNKALEIVSELAQDVEFNDEAPVLPENPTEEELWQYADNHPLVKRVKNVFRGKLVKVEPPKK